MRILSPACSPAALAQAPHLLDVVRGDFPRLSQFDASALQLRQGRVLRHSVRPRFQIDGSEYKLADGSTVVALDVIDDCTRVWVGSRVAAAEKCRAALAAMDAAVAKWGAHGLVLADNGSAFAHTDRSRDKTLTSRFSRTLCERYRIRVIHSSLYHPQTLGNCAAGPRPPPLQHHPPPLRRTAVGITPAEAWQSHPAHGGPGHLPRQDDATVHVLRVSPHGTATPETALPRPRRKPAKPARPPS